MRAASEGWYTQLFAYLFDEAMKGMSGLEILIPNELIDKWAKTGLWLLRRDAILSKDGIVTKSTRNLNPTLDKFLDQMAQATTG